MGQVSSLRRRLVFSWVPALVVLVGLEVFARLFLAPPALGVGGPLGWTSQPNLKDFLVVQLEDQVDFTVTTNADGLRTRYGRQRTPGKHRIVCFGESKIFGWGLPAEESPPEQLQAWLGPAWEVINAGQPGYSSEQARRLAEAVIPAYRPDGVIWFAMWNDLDPSRPDREVLPVHPAALGGRWWNRYSAFIAWFSSRNLPRATSPADMVTREDREELFPVGPLKDIGPGEGSEQGTQSLRVPRDQRTDNVVRMTELARSTDAWMVDVVIPAGGRYVEGGPSRFGGVAVVDAEAAGIPVINLEATLLGWSEDNALTPGDPGHFSGKANHAMMRVLASELTQAVPLPDAQPL